MRPVFTGALVLLAVLVGVFAVRADSSPASAQRAADTRTWQLNGDPVSVSLTRGTADGPIADWILSVREVPCSNGTTNTATSVPSPTLQVAVAADGSFSYSGPDFAPDSQLELSGKFNGRTVSGSFSYSVLDPNGVTCGTPAPVPFTATCIDCPDPPGGAGGREGSAGRSALSAADQFVPFAQIGRGALGTSIAAFQARYPKDLFQERNRDSSSGGTVSFFRLDRRSEPGDPHGLELAIRANKDGKIYMEAAHTYYLDDKSSWLRTAAGVGIGSTVAALRAAYPGLRCGTPTATSCMMVRRTSAGTRLTFFGISDSVRRAAAADTQPRVWSLVVKCAFVSCLPDRLPPKPTP